MVRLFGNLGPKEFITGNGCMGEWLLLMFKVSPFPIINLVEEEARADIAFYLLNFA